jgi:hypothetical protein
MYVEFWWENVWKCGNFEGPEGDGSLVLMLMLQNRVRGWEKDRRRVLVWRCRA